MRPLRLAGLWCVAGIWLLACSGSIDSPALPDVERGDESTRSPVGEAVPIDDATLDFGASIEVADPSAACVGRAYASRRLPVDLYLLVDTSGSMADRTSSGVKWELVSESLVGFLERPENADTGFGIGYFPAPSRADCSPGDPGCQCFAEVNLCLPDPGGSCFVQDYSRPAVPLSLPPAADPLVLDLQRRRLSGETPTRPALEGALSVASAWARAHPDRRTAVVMATDGEPTGCSDNTAEDVVQVAADALSGPHQIRTFVLGVGASLTSLNGIAEAGGTERAFLTDTNGDLLAQLDSALESIRNETACDFAIPEPEGATEIDPERVNVLLTPVASGESRVVGRTSGGLAANCGPGGGWFYDDPTAPASIRLCDDTCRLASEAVVEVEFGCNTVINVR